MNLTAKIFISLDGVYQGGGGPDEDRRGGFDRGGWVASRSDEEVGSLLERFARAQRKMFCESCALA